MSDAQVSDFGEDEYDGPIIEDPLRYDRDTHFYASFIAQEELVRDPLFQEMCRKVVLENKHLYKDKVVLEIDPGLGMLSMVVARFARKVIAIEPSNLADLLSKSATHNRIENIIIIREDIDEIQSLPDEVDILMTQYMGFLLYDRSLFARFIKARDKFLSPRGIVLPDYIRLFISGVDYRKPKGISLEKLGIDHGQVLEEPIKEIVASNRIVTNFEPVRTVNLRTVSADNYNSSHHFHLIGCRTCEVQALALHFDVVFTKCHKPVHLSTSPYERPTRWKQVVLYLENEIPCSSGDTVSGEFVIKGADRDGDPVINFNVRVRNRPGCQQHYVLRDKATKKKNSRQGRCRRTEAFNKG